MKHNLRQYPISSEDLVLYVAAREESSGLSREVDALIRFFLRSVYTKSFVSTLMYFNKLNHSKSSLDRIVARYDCEKHVLEN